MLLIGLMIVSAIAEVATLGALMPFLAVLADPAALSTSAKFASTARFLGIASLSSGQIVTWFSLIFAAVALVTGALRIWLSWLTQTSAYGAGHELGSLLFERLLRQPYAFHVNRNTAEIVGMSNKLDSVIYDVLVQVSSGIAASVIAVFILTALLFIDARTAIIAGTGFGLSYLLLSVLLRGMIGRSGAIISSSYADRVRVTQESLGGIRDVIVDGSYGIFIERHAQVDAALRRGQSTVSFAGLAPRYALEAFGMALIAVLILFLSSGPGGLSAALPILAALALGAQRLLPILQQIYMSWTRVEGSRQSLRDVIEALDLPTIETPSATEPLPFDRALELRNLCFRYDPSGAWALFGVTLKIQKGERIGLVGRTGSGKSTLMDVILGLLRPGSGEMLVDGTALDEASIAAWRARLAHVPQAVYLADTTIAANIAFGATEADIDIDRVRDAARRAQIADHIENLPEAYATIVGERGVRLSGGQRQRLGIARALYKNADVLVLDEATSALDDTTQAEVMAGLCDLGRDVTMILIAHRTTTLDICDRIVRIEAGRIVEERVIAA